MNLRFFLTKILRAVLTLWLVVDAPPVVSEWLSLADQPDDQLLVPPTLALEVSAEPTESVWLMPALCDCPTLVEALALAARLSEALPFTPPFTPTEPPKCTLPNCVPASSGSSVPPLLTLALAPALQPLLSV